MIADGAAGTMDPAFDAHALPAKAWTLALAQGWQTQTTMNAAVARAKQRVLPPAAGDCDATPAGQRTGLAPLWHRVRGPATALVATLFRIGWAVIDATHLRTDTGHTLNLLLDPACVVVAEVHQAVRRWRTRRLAHALPTIMPDKPDVDLSSTHSGCLDVFVNYSDVAARLVYGRNDKAGTKACMLWAPEHKASLKSAVVGGQWPQARLAGIPGWTNDPRCQLCQAAVGTLEHRHCCPATTPVGGWPGGTQAATAFVNGLGADRKRLLRTRGLLVAWFRVPARCAHDTLEWILPFSGDRSPSDPDLIWVVDGSLYDEDRCFARRTGFGVVLIDGAGALVAAARGRPPHWIRDAAGAELWAVQVATALAATTPLLVTDCKGIVDAVQGLPEATIGPTKMLARAWRCVCTNLDWDFQAARRNFRWMPSHGSISSVGEVRDSHGQPITQALWRANRLADALAKSCACADRLPQWATAVVKLASNAVKEQAALLGVVTHAANNHVLHSVDPATGSVVTVHQRDATGSKQLYKVRARGADQSDGPATATYFPSPGSMAMCTDDQQQQECTSVPQHGCEPAGCGPRRKISSCKAQRSRTLRAREHARDAANSAAQVGRWLATKAGTGQGASASTQDGTAADRLAALRQRVRARALNGALGC